jgi:hypothetical protein
MAIKKIEQDLKIYNVGQGIIHTEYGTTYEIKSRVGDVYTLKYTSDDRPDTTMLSKHITSMLKNGRWKLL